MIRLATSARDAEGTDSYLLLSNTVTTTSAAALNLLSQGDAKASMALIDATLTRIQQELGAIGSVQSRLNVAASNLDVSRENVLAAGS